MRETLCWSRRRVAVPIQHEDEKLIPERIAGSPRTFYQLLDLGVGEIVNRLDVGIDWSVSIVTLPITGIGRLRRLARKPLIFGLGHIVTLPEIPRTGNVSAVDDSAS